MTESHTTIADFSKQLFLELSQIDNPSKDEKAMAAAVSRHLDHFNVNHQTDELFNVYGKIEGEGEPIVLCAHLDAVDPCIGKEPQFDGEYFFTNAKTVLGSDDLVGVCAILGMLQFLEGANRPIEILFTTQEEIGGAGVKYFLKNNTLDATDVLILDSLQPVGGIITSSPSKYNFTLKVFGHGQHGSQNNANAVSAISKIAEIIHQWPVGQIDDHTMLNLGMINGGSAVNTIPGEASVEGCLEVEAIGEMRSSSLETEERVLRELREIVDEADKKYSTVDSMFECTQVRSSYRHSEDDPLIASIKDSFHAIDIVPFTKASRGTSDANTINQHGLRGILLGTGVENAHTVNERVRLSEIVDLTRFLVEFVQKKG